MCRFPQALQCLESGLKVATNVRYTQVTWPGTHSLIYETTQQGLEVSAGLVLIFWLVDLVKIGSVSLEVRKLVNGLIWPGMHSFISETTLQGL